VSGTCLTRTTMFTPDCPLESRLWTDAKHFQLAKRLLSLAAIKLS
jgi:hypothetical protein